MREEYCTPDVLDFAYQVIAMDEEISHLRRELEHYKKMHEMHCKSMNNSLESSKKFVGIILSAALDPESAINKGHDAIIKEQTGSGD